jgi:glycosyltransferase involved in cell wall biosynthesis
MKILFFVQHFYPSREIGAKRPSEMAAFFLAQGHSVDVLCATETTPWNKRHEQMLAKARITQVPVPADLIAGTWKMVKKVIRPAGRPTSAASNNGGGALADARAFTQTRDARRVFFAKRWFFSMEALWCGLKAWSARCVPRAISLLRNNRYDVVINSCPPMSTALAMLFARPFATQKFFWVIDLRDPFMYRAIGSNNTWLRQALERWAERKCYRQCDLITVASPGLGADVAARHPDVAHKVHVIYNGFDSQQRQPATEGKSATATEPNTVKLLFAGTMYLNRDPRPLCEAIGIAIERHGMPRDAIHLTLLGIFESPTRDALQKWLDERELSHAVTLLDAVSPQEVERFVDAADVLINFAQAQKMMIPAKTYDYMASGKETITITEEDSETAKVVRKVRGGPVAPQDADALALALVDLYRRYIVRREPFAPDVAAIAEFARQRQSENMLERIATLTRVAPSA